METETLTPTLTKNELQAHLNAFKGTEQYYPHHITPSCKIMLTDGSVYLANTAQCYWLFDLIASYQYKKVFRHAEFQVWKLSQQEEGWLITCTDGNDNILGKQEIRYSDFPLDGITIWFSNGVAMLPTEY